MVEVVMYEVKCSLCGLKIRAMSKSGCDEQLSNHVDNECKVAVTIRDWDKRGVYKEMVTFLGHQALSGKLEKLVKKYGFEEVKDALMELET